MLHFWRFLVAVLELLIGVQRKLQALVTTGVDNASPLGRWAGRQTAEHAWAWQDDFEW
jgi:hypothetical protein